MDPFLGEIRAFGFGFAPRGWLQCNGALLAIQSNTALFSLLGTTYGGNGVTTFALPDLRGRVPIGFGTGPGLSNFVLGEQGGVETVTLAPSQIPVHTHRVVATLTTGSVALPAGGGTENIIATAATKPTGGVPAPLYATGATPQPLSPNSVSTTGSGQSHPNIQPTSVGNYCIATSGVFPSRN